MSAVMEDILESALKLPAESQTELIEALLSNYAPQKEVLDDQLAIVNERVKNVKLGKSYTVSAESAHEYVLNSLQISE